MRPLTPSFANESKTEVRFPPHSTTGSRLIGSQSQLEVGEYHGTFFLSDGGEYPVSMTTGQTLLAFN